MRQGCLKQSNNLLRAVHCFTHSRQRAVTEASRKFSLQLACEGCSVMPSGWQSSRSEKLKRAKGLERNLSSLSLLSSSAQTFFLPETWETRSRRASWARVSKQAMYFWRPYAAEATPPESGTWSRFLKTSVSRPWCTALPIPTVSPSAMASAADMHEGLRVALWGRLHAGQ